MGRDVDLPVAIARIEQCIDASDDEVVESSTNGDEGIYWHLQRGGYHVRVRHPEDLDYFTVGFGYDMRDDVVGVIGDDDATKVLESSDRDGEDGEELETVEARQYAAAEVLMDGTPDEVSSAYASELVRIMSRPNLFFEFLQTASGTVTGFDLSTALYPFADGFRFREYDQAVQSVVTVGRAAMVYSRRALDVEEAVSVHGTSEPLPYIQ